jgi:hypothetical protein
MTEKQQGQYIHLLSHAWLSEEPGTLPMPVEVAARLVGWKPSKLRSFFAQFPTAFVPILNANWTNSGPKRDLFVNEFVHDQWIRYQEISEIRRKAASKCPANAKQEHRSSPSPAVAPSNSTPKYTRSARSSPSYVGQGPVAQMKCRDCGEVFQRQAERDSHECPKMSKVQ